MLRGDQGPRFRRPMLATAVAVASAACFPLLFCSCFEGLVANKPLSDPRMDQIDEALLGEWELVEPAFDPRREPPIPQRLKITDAKEAEAKGIMRFEIELENLDPDVAQDKDRTSIRSASLATSVTIGKRKFLNFLIKEPLPGEFSMLPANRKHPKLKHFSYQKWRESDSKQVSIVTYRVTDEQLRIVTYTESLRNRQEALQKANPDEDPSTLILKVIAEVDEADEEFASEVIYRRVTTDKVPKSDD